MHSLGHFLLTFGADFTSFGSNFKHESSQFLRIKSDGSKSQAHQGWHAFLELLTFQTASFNIIIGPLGRKYPLLQGGKYLLIFKLPIIALIGLVWTIMFMFTF